MTPALSLSSVLDFAIVSNPRLPRTQVGDVLRITVLREKSTFEVDVTLEAKSSLEPGSKQQPGSKQEQQPQPNS